jgi:uncharacterized lipoprotein YmbA
MKPWNRSLLPRTSGRPLATIALAASLGALAACSLSRPAPVKHMYLLEPAAAAPVAKPHDASVRIGMITVAASFRGRTLVYRRDDVTYESDFYSEFFVAPQAMLADATAKALTAANVFKRITPSGSAPYESDYVLDAFVTELYGDLREAGKAASVLSVTFYLSHAGVVTPKVVWTKEYRQRVAAADGSPEALVRGWNAALSTIMSELTRDLAALSLPAQP